VQILHPIDVPPARWSDALHHGRKGYWMGADHGRLALAAVSTVVVARPAPAHRRGRLVAARRHRFAPTLTARGLRQTKRGTLSVVR
jgi:hypothetical protein